MTTPLRWDKSSFGALISFVWDHQAPDLAAAVQMWRSKRGRMTSLYTYSVFIPVGIWVCILSLFHHGLLDCQHMRALRSLYKIKSQIAFVGLLLILEVDNASRLPCTVRYMCGTCVLVTHSPPEIPYLRRRMLGSLANLLGSYFFSTSPFVSHVSLASLMDFFLVSWYQVLACSSKLGVRDAVGSKFWEWLYCCSRSSPEGTGVESIDYWWPWARGGCKRCKRKFWSAAFARSNLDLNKGIEWCICSRTGLQPQAVNNQAAQASWCHVSPKYFQGYNIWTLQQISKCHG